MKQLGISLLWIFAGNISSQQQIPLLLQLLLADTRLSVNGQDLEGWTALMWASEYKYQEVIGTDQIKYTTNQNRLFRSREWYFLIRSVPGNKTRKTRVILVLGNSRFQLHLGNLHQVVRRLLARGANPHLRDKEQNTALHWAAFSGSADTISQLLHAKCEIDALNERGEWENNDLGLPNWKLKFP